MWWTLFSEFLCLGCFGFYIRHILSRSRANNLLLGLRQLSANVPHPCPNLGDGESSCGTQSDAGELRIRIYVFTGFSSPSGRAVFWRRSNRISNFGCQYIRVCGSGNDPGSLWYPVSRKRIESDQDLMACGSCFPCCFANLLVSDLAWLSRRFWNGNYKWHPLRASFQTSLGTLKVADVRPGSHDCKSSM